MAVITDFPTAALGEFKSVEAPAGALTSCEQLVQTRIDELNAGASAKQALDEFISMLDNARCAAQVFSREDQKTLLQLFDVSQSALEGHSKKSRMS